LQLPIRWAALYGVAATSAGNAWVVGAYATVSGSGSSDKTIISHWNGIAWK
jgi:ABC-type sulfate transport system permease subunit